MLEDDIGELLPVNLLPEGTTRYNSTAYAGRVWHACAVASAITGGALAIGGSTALVGAGVCFLFVACGALYAWWRFRVKPRYNEQIAGGNWPWGVLVFSSGDLSVTLPGVWRKTELTIELPYLSRADAVRSQWSWRRCWWGPALCLYFLSLDARPRTLAIDQAQLVDDVALIAATINAHKARNTSSALA